MTAADLPLYMTVLDGPTATIFPLFGTLFTIQLVRSLRDLFGV